MKARNNNRSWLDDFKTVFTGVLAGGFLACSVIWTSPDAIAGEKSAGCGCATGEGAGIQAGAQLWIEPPNIKFLAGADFVLRFHVGNAGAPVQSLFGLSFELRYSDDKYLEFVQPVEAQAGDFLQPDIYTFTRHEPENKVFYLAVSRKRGAAGKNGDGVVLTLPVKIADNAPPGWKVCFVVNSVSANDSVGAALQVEAGPQMCIEVEEPAIDVVPNPFTPNGDGFNDRTEFKRDGGIPSDWQILIMDRSGRVIRRLTNGQDKWDGRDEDGRPALTDAYLYTIRDGDRVVLRGVLGIIR